MEGKIVIDKDSIDILKNLFPTYNSMFSCADGEIYCTLIHRFQVEDNKEKYKRIQAQIGDSIWPIVITHIGYGNETLAFRIMKSCVIESICVDENPLIIIGSSEIEYWEKLDKVIIVKGTIR